MRFKNWLLAGAILPMFVLGADGAQAQQQQPCRNPKECQNRPPSPPNPAAQQKAQQAAQQAAQQRAQQAAQQAAQAKAQAAQAAQMKAQQAAQQAAQQKAQQAAQQAAQAKAQQAAQQAAQAKAQQAQQAQQLKAQQAQQAAQQAAQAKAQAAQAAQQKAQQAQQAAQQAAQAKAQQAAQAKAQAEQQKLQQQQLLQQQKAQQLQQQQLQQQQKAQQLQQQKAPVGAAAPALAPQPQLQQQRAPVGAAAPAPAPALAPQPQQAAQPKPDSETFTNRRPDGTLMCGAKPCTNQGPRPDLGLPACRSPNDNPITMECIQVRKPGQAQPPAAAVPQPPAPVPGIPATSAGTLQGRTPGMPQWRRSDGQLMCGDFPCSPAGGNAQAPGKPATPVVSSPPNPPAQVPPVAAQPAPLPVKPATPVVTSPPNPPAQVPPVAAQPAPLPVKPATPVVTSPPNPPVQVPPVAAQPAPLPVKPATPVVTSPPNPPAQVPPVAGQPAPLPGKPAVAQPAPLVPAPGAPTTVPPVAGQPAPLPGKPAVAQPAPLVPAPGAPTTVPPVASQPALVPGKPATPGAQPAPLPGTPVAVPPVASQPGVPVLRGTTTPGAVTNVPGGTTTNIQGGNTTTNIYQNTTTTNVQGGTTVLQPGFQPMQPMQPGFQPGPQPIRREGGIGAAGAAAIGVGVGLVGGYVLSNQIRGGVNEVRTYRESYQDGGVTYVREPGRVIIREQNGAAFIRSDYGERFSMLGYQARQERDGAYYRNYYDRPDGVRIINITDDSGRLVRRVRRYSDGREMILIDNSFRAPPARFADQVVVMAPPVLTIPRERYIVDAGVADEATIYEALTAPPLTKVTRRYTLDEVRYSSTLRAQVRSVDINTITFETGSWFVDQSQVSRLATIAAAINKAIQVNASEVFLIEGHTDAVGDPNDNLSLSDRRAQAVAEILTRDYGIPAENLETQGYGETQLRVQTDGAARANRRVTLRRITSLITGTSVDTSATGAAAATAYSSTGDAASQTVIETQTQVVPGQTVIETQTEVVPGQTVITTQPQ